MSTIAPPKRKFPPAQPVFVVETAVTRRRWAVVEQSPSWLVSASLHLLAIVILGLVAVAEQVSLGRAVELVAGATDAEWVQDDRFEFQTTLETAGDVAVSPPAGIDIGPAVGELADLNSDAALQFDDGDCVDGLPFQTSGWFGADGPAMRTIPIANQGAEFYGVRARGNRFVFIVDSSNSMRGLRFEEAKRELLYSIRRLKSDQYFYVIFFDHDSERMVLDPDEGPSAFPVPATMRNIRRLEDWVQTVANDRLTNPYEAVEFALSIAPDAIYLLTDGQFTDRGRTVRYLARENVQRDDLGKRQVKVPLHTIGFYSRDGENVLRDIAKKYGGTYQFVGPK